MNIGFIGAGNMASAIIGGIVKSGLEYDSIIVSDLSKEKLQDISEKFNVSTTTENCTAAENADILFICVKPNVVEAVSKDIKESISCDTVVVSIAAGVTLNALERYFGNDKKIVRIMPNTPALVGEAMSALCYNNIAENDYKQVVDIMNSLGSCCVVSESLFDVVTAVSGSSPAYVFMFIEAMADGAVQGGMNRDLAYKFAAQSVLGSAKMVLETGKHPGELKDMVCSPGGTTIEAVAVLEQTGFRNSVIEAMNACRDKSIQMQKKS